MENYERPEVIATYSTEELTEEAAVCIFYNGSPA
jgi:hypothetical protein